MNLILQSNTPVYASLRDKTIARDFFTEHLPRDILNDVNLNVLELCNQSYIHHEFKFVQSDILYTTEIKGQVGYLYLICEHNSAPDQEILFYLRQYNVHILQYHSKKIPTSLFPKIPCPMIVNMVFYNGQTRYVYAVDLNHWMKAPEELFNS